ncbi:MAG: hypothetical protein DME96_11900 [Verrucomicrobia bacterium]|nr:MAG: hypothetical protein DME96_11900 [Verrucomicrobiota bacterium]
MPSGTHKWDLGGRVSTDRLLPEIHDRARREVKRSKPRANAAMGSAAGWTDTSVRDFMPELKRAARIV